MPKPPTAASGIAEILFDIGGILNADPRNQRADLGADLRPARRRPEARPRLRLADDRRALRAVAAHPQGDRRLGKIGAELAALLAGAAAHRPRSTPRRSSFDQAVTPARTLVAEKPDRIDAALTLADLLRGKERYAEAVAAYDTAISAHQATSRSATGRSSSAAASSLERIKQWPKAEADMKKALELSPEQPYVLNYLGYSWIDQGLQSRRRHEDAEARDRASARRRRDHRFGRLGLLPARPVRQGGRVAASGRASRRATTPPSSSISATPTGMSAASARRASSGSARSTRSPTRTASR